MIAEDSYAKLAETQKLDLSVIHPNSKAKTMLENFTVAE